MPNRILPYPPLTLVLGQDRATRWDNLQHKRCWLESVQWGDLAGNLHANYRSVYLNSYYVCFFCDTQEQLCLPYVLPGGLDHVLPLLADDHPAAGDVGNSQTRPATATNAGGTHPPVSHHHLSSIPVPGPHFLGRVSCLYTK